MVFVDCVTNITVFVCARIIILHTPTLCFCYYHLPAFVIFIEAVCGMYFKFTSTTRSISIQFAFLVANYFCCLERNFLHMSNLHFQFHALSSCLKAISTSDSAYLIEQCRHACGGHGYMLSSGIPNLYNFVSATRTYEGDYTVLLLQTARLVA